MANEDTLSECLKMLVQDKNTIPYRRAFVQLTNSHAAAILLQQMIYLWTNRDRQPFYKYKEPVVIHNTSKTTLYRDGDSWCEETGFNRTEFDYALRIIGTKIKKGVSKTQLLVTDVPTRHIEESNADFLERMKAAVACLVLYWTDSNRLTWYQLNEQLLCKFINMIYLDKSCGLRYIVSAVATDTYKSRKDGLSAKSGQPALLLIPKTPTKISAEIPTQTLSDAKNASERDSTASLFSTLRPVDVEETNAIDTLVETLYARRAEAAEKVAEKMLASASTESQAPPPKSKPKRVTPLRERKPKEQKPEPPKLRAKNPLYEAVCYAFRFDPKGERTGGMAGTLGNFLTGKVSPKKRGTDWETFMLNGDDTDGDAPMTSAEIVGFGMWYRAEERYREKEKPPMTPSTLRDRVEEFRASPKYDLALMRGSERLNILCELSPIGEKVQPIPEPEKVFDSSPPDDVQSAEPEGDYSFLDGLFALVKAKDTDQ